MESIPYQLGSPHSLVQELLRRNAQRLKSAEAAPLQPPLPAFTIAVSRESGTRAVEISRAIAAKLGWHVFDRELVERVAEDLGLRSSLLDAVDEKRTNWIQETLESLRGPLAAVSGAGYVRHLVTTLLSLAAHGECVIVGRGGAQVLPAATTLRVRMIAPMPYRAAVLSEQLGVGRDEAVRRAKQIDAERSQFVEQHFHKNPVDAHDYDLVLNVARFGIDEAAIAVIAALEALRSTPPAEPGK